MLDCEDSLSLSRRPPDSRRREDGPEPSDAVRRRESWSLRKTAQSGGQGQSGGTLNKKVAVPDAQVSQVLHVLAKKNAVEIYQAKFLEKLVSCAAEHAHKGGVLLQPIFCLGPLSDIVQSCDVGGAVTVPGQRRESGVNFFSSG